VGNKTRSRPSGSRHCLYVSCSNFLPNAAWTFLVFELCNNLKSFITHVNIVTFHTFISQDMTMNLCFFSFFPFQYLPPDQTSHWRPVKLHPCFRPANSHHEHRPTRDVSLSLSHCVLEPSKLYS
jgi:hypothetical protein